MRKLALAVAVPVLLASASASAHFNLIMPPSSANDTVGGKGSPPCGPDVAEGTVTQVMGGSNLMLNITETVRHGGFYRVALALTSCHKSVAGMPKCFPADNTVYDSGGKVLVAGGAGTSDHADITMPPVFPVLADGLFQHVQAGTAEKYAGMVAIPNVSCDKCTLQVIEFMAPHGTNGDAGFFYHHCADLKITQDATKPPYPNGTGGGGAGGAAGSAGTAGSATGGGGAGGSGGTGTGTSGTSTGGTIGTSGTSTGGTGVTAGGTTTTPTGGTATAGTTTLPTSGSGGAAGANTVTVVDDGGGCGIAGRAPGGATALAALGLLLGLVRRRRAR